MYEYLYDKDKCWYLDVCNSENCNAGCIRYMEMDYLMQTSQIPKARRYPTALTPAKKDIQAFVFLKGLKDDIENFVINGESLYIYSDGFGNGKTSWAIKLMQAYFNRVWASNGFRCRGIFVHVPSFLVKIKDVISNKDDEFSDLKNKLSSVDIVVWDDIASTKLSDFDHQNLLTYIDNRKLNQLSNIYTGNLSGDELQTALGNRLYSRVWNDSTQVRFFGEDRRGAL